MDLSTFSNVCFDPAEWINYTLKNVDGDSTNDAKVSSVMAKLQVHYHHLNNELEDTSQIIMNNLPRTLHDIENLAKEAMTLKEKMSSVKEEISNVEKNTGTSIASLEKINDIKVELVKAKQALYEADNWTMLSADIETVFETCEIDLISSKLVSMQQSLNVLSNASDFEYKKNHLESLKNRLEALASPYVVESFTTKSVEQAKKLVKIFDEMGRFPLLVKYYSDCQKSTLIYQWQFLRDLDSDENVIVSFQNYYDFLQVNWQEQIKWCEEVMPNLSSTAVLVELYIDLLITLSVNFSKIIEDHLKTTEEPLLWLSQLKNCSKTFALNLKTKIGSYEIDHNSLKSLAKAVYLPYVSHLAKYCSLQKSVFSHHLLELTKNIETSDFIQTLGQKISSLLSVSQKYLKVCVDLSEGCCLPDFLVSSEYFFKNFLEKFKSIPYVGTGTENRQSDFGTFQMFVTVLQHLGDMIIAVKQLDQECVEAIIVSSNTCKKGEGDPFVAYDKLLMLSDSDFIALCNTVSDSSEPSVMEGTVNAIEKVCREIYQASFNIIFGPILSLLKSVRNPSTLKPVTLSADLPDYSFSPQEYITQIGQYLINLPQLLEPFLSLDNSSLNLALGTVSEFAILSTGDEEGNGFVDLLLGAIAKSTCQAYSDIILTIPSVSASSSKQLITDINYLGNVLEDFGFTLTDTLKNILFLMKLSPAEYSTQCAGCSPQLVAAVRQMRNIIPE